MNIYVGNLSFDSSEDDVRRKFEEFGEVSSVKVISDRLTGKSRGFGFVEMPDDDAARTAIAEISGKDFMGRVLNVSEARRREGGPPPRRDR
jgi:RNA recognition motif-containing protein